MKHPTQTMAWLVICLFALSLLVYPTYLSAQTTQPSKNVTKAKSSKPSDNKSVDMVELNLPGSFQMVTLVKYVGKRLNITFVYDEAGLRKKVTMSGPLKVPRASLESLLVSVLRMNGFVVVDDAEKVGWKRIEVAKNFVPLPHRIREAGSDADVRADEVMTQLFQLKYLDATSAGRMIQPVLTQSEPVVSSRRTSKRSSRNNSSPDIVSSGNLIILPENALLVVTDYADVLGKVSFLIRLADQPDKRRPRFIPLKYAGAEEVVQKVAALLWGEQTNSRRRSPGNLKDGSPKLIADERMNQVIVVSSPEEVEEIEGYVHSFDVPLDVQKATYSFTYITPSMMDKVIRELGCTERELGLYKSMCDDKAKKLYVVASPAIHRKIESWKKELDTPESGTEYQQVKFYKLLNRKAEDVLATLGNLDMGEGYFEISSGSITSSKTADTAKFTGPNVAPPALGKALPKPPAYKRRIQSSGSNSATASQDDDTQKAQYRVTADVDTNTIIVIAPPTIQARYEEMIRTLDKRQAQVLVQAMMVTLDTTNDSELGVELLGKFDANGNDTLLFSSFGLSEVDTVTGSLTIKPGVGFNGTIVNPSTFNAVIRALASNSRAKIIAEPRALVNDNATATLTSVNEQPFTSVNASETVSTTSFGGYAEAGSTLTVTPHVSEGDHLQLEYTITLNSFSGDSENGIPPPRQTNELTSEATFPNGYAIIVGGLKRKDKTKGRNKIPYLGDIPLLGKAFSLESNTDHESTLYVFIRATILRDDEFRDLKYFSQKDLEAAEQPLNLPKSIPILMK